MTSIDIKPRNDTPKSLFNPLKTDFICPLRDDKNIYHNYKIRSMEIESFPTWMAEVIIKHLIVAVQNERKVNPIDIEAIEEIRKEVVVDEI